jgi:hypothetical protein
MKHTFNSQKGSTPILVAIVAILVIVGIWYALTRSAKTGDTTQPVIVLMSPNGREKFEIGEYIPVTFDVAGEVKEDQFVAFYLYPGAAPLALTTATTTKFALMVPENILIGGDASAPLEPGKYTLRATLFQGRPCLGHCVTASSTELGFDETDSEIIIVRPAATPTSSVGATSTAATSTNK